MALVPWSWLAFLAAAGTTPATGPEPQTLTIELRHGDCANEKSALAFEAALARTEPERERGLGFRTVPLKKYEGMLFVYDIPGPRTFWMKETHIPLAIFYFDAQGKLLSSAEMPVEPDPANPTKLYPEKGNSSAILEVSKGLTKTVQAHRLDTLCLPAAAK